MATRKARGRTIIKFSDDDFSGKRKFPRVPNGTYFIRSDKGKNTIESGNAGPYIKAQWSIVKGPHKGKTKLFTNLSSATPWRLAQVILAAGISKEKGKKMTMEDILALLNKGLDLRAVVNTEPAQNGYPKKNGVKQFLPLESTADDDDVDDEDEDELDEDDEDEDDDEDLDEDDDEDEDDEDEDEDEDEDDEDLDEEDEDEDDEDEDDEEDEDLDEDEDEDEDEDDEDEDNDEDEEDDEEEEEQPKRRGRKPAAKRAAPKKRAVAKRGRR